MLILEKGVIKSQKELGVSADEHTAAGCGGSECGPIGVDEASGQCVCLRFVHVQMHCPSFPNVIVIQGMLHLSVHQHTAAGCSSSES